MFPGQILAGARAVELASRLTQQLTQPGSKNAETFKSVLNNKVQAAANSSAKTVPVREAAGKNAVATLQTETQKLLDRLATQLQQLLAQQGINTEQPIVFEIDSFGDLRISGSHPNALDIEVTLFQNPELAELAQSIITNRIQLEDHPNAVASQARLIMQGNQAQVAFVKPDAASL